MGLVKVAPVRADEGDVGDPRPDQIDLSAVHASMPQGLAVVSADGTIREVNDHVLTMLGRTREPGPVWSSSWRRPTTT